MAIELLSSHFLECISCMDNLDCHAHPLGNRFVMFMLLISNFVNNYVASMAENNTKVNKVYCFGLCSSLYELFFTCNIFIHTHTSCSNHQRFSGSMECLREAGTTFALMTFSSIQRYSTLEKNIAVQMNDIP